MRLSILASASLFAMATMANAADMASSQGYFQPGGHVGVSGGMLDVKQKENGSYNDERPGFLRIDGSLSLPIGSDAVLIGDGVYQKDYFDNDTFDSSSPEDESSLDWQYMLGGHMLLNLDGAYFGLMGGYGDSENREKDAYSIYLVGAELQSFLSEDLLFFGQAGFGDNKKAHSTSPEEGFRNGVFGRVGFRQFLTDNSSITLEGEYSYVKRYIDGNDAGKFASVTIYGETSLTEGANPISLTYGARFSNIDATTEQDWLKEWSYSAGLKFAFGGTSIERAKSGAAIGMPYLPLRAAHWTETLD